MAVIGRAGQCAVARDAQPGRAGLQAVAQRVARVDVAGGTGDRADIGGVLGRAGSGDRIGGEARCLVWLPTCGDVKVIDERSVGCSVVAHVETCGMNEHVQGEWILRDPASAV